IDLVFRHEGRYYLLDYKSNWLGEDREAYTRPATLTRLSASTIPSLPTRRRWISARCAAC
ncbi:hypothetical protein CP989_24555, partial [Enterobacter hormaechei]|uniref:hypothetical protein n=1 Tax=Enterobacter hormaechei TaxID=158836 RepID=UPI000BC745B7